MSRGHFHSPKIRHVSGALLGLLLLTTSTQTFAHGGHGNEFQGGNAAQTVGEIHVDAETIKRLGLKVEKVSRQRLAFGVKTTGQIEALPNQTVEVTTPVGGTVIRLLVKPGDAVEVGQPVAMMTSPDLAGLRTTALDRRVDAIASIQQAEADLRLAQETYQQQQKITAMDVQQVRTELSFAQERFDKDRELLTNGAIPRRTFLESETKLAEVKAVLTKAESRLQVSEAVAQLKRAQSGVEVAQSRLSLSGDTYQTRLRQLGATPNQDGTITITAPIAGIVADRETTTGESGQDAGKKIMTIVNGRGVQVSANIYEKDLGRIQTGQRVQVQVSGLPDRTFEGRISVIGASVQGETRVVPVKAELDNPAGALKPGMFAELEVLTDRSPAAVLTIPKSAIVETNNKKSIVFVQNGTAFVPSEVTLGNESGGFVEVKSGVFDGDVIVTQRANQLYAQSLMKSGHSTATAAPGGEPGSNRPENGLGLPWWVMIPAGGAIAAGTFWAGTLWAKRRSPPALSTNNGKSYPVNSETDGQFAPVTHPAHSHPVPSLQELQTPKFPDQE